MARGRGRRVVELGSGDWYELPSWYDILHTPGTAREVDGLEKIAARYATGGGRGRAGVRWLEPACGSGRYLRVLARRGGVVHGFDRSAAMAAYARKSLARRGLSGRVWVAEMEEFAMGGGARVDVAFTLISTIRHLMTDRAVLEHLGCVARTLRPGGVYAVGTGVVAYGAEQESEDVWVGRRGGCEVTQVVQFLPPERKGRRERVINHLTVVTGREEKHFDNTYDLRAYSGREWVGLLARSGLELVAVVDDFGEEQGPVAEWSGEDRSGYGVWVLRRARGGAGRGSGSGRRLGSGGGNGRSGRVARA